MTSISLVFPHQLYRDHPALNPKRPVYLVEEFLFFRQYNFHKQKLAFHRASMKAYERFLTTNGYQVHYIDTKEKTSDVRHLLPYLKKNGVAEIHYSDVTDNFLERRIATKSLELGISMKKCHSMLFLLNAGDVDRYFSGKKRFFQTDFYIAQRKHFNILVDDNREPLGGKWSFDTDNRLKYPSKKKAPLVTFPEPNEYWKESITYVEKNFPSNYGHQGNWFVYPTTFEESVAWLDDFLKNRFEEFGAYEDAIVRQESILHHSVLTPMLNVGLLTPDLVLSRAVDFAKKRNIPMNSCEGFVRQILGWREFIRGVYETKGTEQRTKNYWKFSRKIPPAFWDGTTGIVPVDNTIRKVLSTGYCHHIERLMVLGNFMLLCEFDPDEVYEWFMSLFIDAYDWVMVTNVYGMSQFADGGLMSTKPYISASNYIMKMSDFGKGEWQQVWDGLFWRFMHTHRDFFLKNPRLGMLVKTFDKMAEGKRRAHLEVAEEYLGKIDSWGLKKAI